MRLGSEQRLLLEARVSEYVKSLPSALDYLESRRISKELAVRFRLGVVEIEHPGEERFLGRLSIPYQTRSGVVDVRYRRLPKLQEGEWRESSSREPKYLGRVGSNTHLFNTEAVFRANDRVALTEGELDTVVCARLGIQAVGVPGVNNWKPHYRNILEDFSRVVVFGDGDRPGREFANKISAEIGDSARAVWLPDGQDIGSLCMDAMGDEWVMEKFYGA